MISGGDRPYIRPAHQSKDLIDRCIHPRRAMVKRHDLIWESQDYPVDYPLEGGDLDTRKC